MVSSLPSFAPANAACPVPKRQPTRHYRRPTEAEWEYAARGGTETTFSFGDSEKNANYYAWTARSSGGETHPVAELRTNGFGLHDMHGNVWEWVEDVYGAYPKGSVKNPTGPSSGPYRVFRGGCVWSMPQYWCSAVRGSTSPDHGNADIGFRLVRTPKP
jgi:formylglycine-generating enzyme required for sulfatase activity